MKSYFHLTLICIGYLIISVESWCITSLPDSIISYFNKQLFLYPQEKIYVQIDKPYYITGEDIWFRAYLVDAHNHFPDSTSRYIYGELIDPVQNVVKRVKIRPENGAYHGHISLTDDLAEGNYQLRFYTKYMQAVGEDFFFRRSVRIGTPLSAQYRAEVHSEYDKRKNNMDIDIRIKDTRTDEQIIPDEVLFSDGKGEMKKINPDKYGTLHISMKNMKSPGPVVYLEYRYKGKKQTQYIPVLSPEKDYDVNFFPEGGNLVSGTFNRIAFKAINNNGIGEDIQVVIVDEKQDTIQQFKSSYLGMGSFFLNTNTQEKLYAICRNSEGLEKKVLLPTASENNLSLHINHFRDQLRVTIKKSPERTLQQPLFLIAHNRGTVILCTSWNFSKEVINLRKEELPSGVIQFILTDENLNPISERMVFINNKSDQTNLSFSTDKSIYKSREWISSSLLLTDQDGNPLEGNFSMSVTDNNDVKIDSCVNILTTLLLTSDIKGHIESPAYYFKNESNERIINLDILMLTQGWSRYNISKILKNTPEIPERRIELAQEISGVVKGGFLMSKPTADYPVTLMSFEPFFYDETVSDENGQFSFRYFELPDSTNYLIQGKTKKGRSRVEVLVDAEAFPEVISLMPLNHNHPDQNEFEQYLKKADEQYTSVHGIRTIHLEDVVVTAPEIKPGRSMYSSSFNKRISSEEIEKFPTASIYHLLQRFPEITIQETELGDKKMLLRNLGATGEPVLVIDNIIMDHVYIETLSVSAIEEIELVRGAQSSMFGLRGLYGAIVITTKKGVTSAEKEVFNMKTVTPLGFQITKEFYSPKYETPEEINSIKPDLRSTIYWNPDIKTSEDGKADISFYAADPSTTYSVVIEGVSSQGILIYSIQSIKREE